MALFPVNPPNGASLFTLSNNATSATHSYNDGAHAMNMIATDTGAASTERVRFRGKAVPAGSSWSCILGMWTTPFGRSGSQYLRCGLGLLENSTGKSLAICYNTQGSTPVISNYYFSALGTYSSTLGTETTVFGGRQPLMFRISYNGTNYTFDYSLDFGNSWTTLSTLAKASYFTADRVGLWIETYGTFNAGHPRMEAYYYEDPDFPA